MDNIIGPQGTQKPPEGIKCWWTAADYEKEAIKKYGRAHLSALKCQIEVEGYSDKYGPVMPEPTTRRERYLMERKKALRRLNRNIRLSRIEPIRKFGGELITGYKVHMFPERESYSMDNLRYPVPYVSICKSDSWWIKRIIQHWQKENIAFERSQSRIRRKEIRKVYEADGEITIP